MVSDYVFHLRTTHPVVLLLVLHLSIGGALCLKSETTCEKITA